MVNEPSDIHRSINIARCRLKNRLVALPVFTGYAYTDGSVSPLMINHYKELARSGVALVIVANAAVSADGITSRHTLRIDHDKFITGLSGLARAIKRQGALSAIQLNHAGRYAKTDRPLVVSRLDAENLPYNLFSMKCFINAFPLEKRFALTRLFIKQINTWRQEMAPDEMIRVMEDFQRAAQRAVHAGFDMIELHGANGYLLCEFLSSTTHRNNCGSPDASLHRTFFPLALIRRIRKTLPQDLPLGFRLLVNEFLPGGITLDDAVAFARLAEEAGVSYLSAAVGTFNTVFKAEIVRKMAKPAYLKKDLIRLTKAVGIPTIISGRIVSPSLANTLLRKKTADLIGLGRPLRVDSNWVKKAETDKETDILHCINCNWCLKRVILDQGFSCVRWPKIKQQQIDFEHRKLSCCYTCLWVITQKKELVGFKSAFAALLQNRSNRSLLPTVLFLQRALQDDLSVKDRGALLAWIKGKLAELDYPEKDIPFFVKYKRPDLFEVVTEEIDRLDYGFILIPAGGKERWQERLLYRTHRRAIGLIQKTRRPTDFLVCLDLSDASLEILMFLGECYKNRSNINLTFFHVLNSSQRRAEDRWTELKRITGIASGAPIRFADPNTDVAAEIIATAEAGDYGTVVMGKRGRSGIKRMLMGSVSRRVKDGIKGRNLVLVD